MVSAGSDGILDDPNNEGKYSLLIGGIQVSVGGLRQFSFIEGKEVNVSINVLNSDEGTDRVEFEAQHPFVGSILVTFLGDLTGNFVNASVEDTGLDAVNQINWAHFSSGNMMITSSNPLEEMSTLGAISLPDNEAYFVINNVNDVPEPGTALVVLAGVAAIYLRRR